MFISSKYQKTIRVGTFQTFFWETFKVCLTTLQFRACLRATGVQTGSAHSTARIETTLKQNYVLSKIVILDGHKNYSLVFVPTQAQ